MNPRNTWLLVAMAVGLFAFIYFYEARAPKPVPVVPKVLLGFKSAEVTSLRIQPRGQQEIRVDRTNGAWQLTRPVVYPVKASAVEDLLKALDGLTSQMRLSSRTGHASQEFGIDDPLATIVALQPGEEPQRLYIGNRTAPGDQVYAQVRGQADVDVISAEFLNSVPTNANEWRDTAFVNLQGAPLDRVLVANGSKSFELQWIETNQLWRMSNLNVRADNYIVKLAVDSVQSIRVVDFVTDDARTGLDVYGLQPPQTELTLAQGTNVLCSLQFGKSYPANPNLVYARSNGQSTVVLIPADLVTPWRLEAAVYRDRHLLNPASEVNEIYFLEFAGQQPANNFTIAYSNGVWLLTDAEKQSFPADPWLIGAFLQNLSSIEVVMQPRDQVAYKDVVPDSEWPKYGLMPNPVRRYLLQRGGSTNSTGASGTIFARIDFGTTYEDGNIFARRSDVAFENSVYLVKPSDFQRLPSSAIQFRNRRIWDIASSNVVRLNIRVNDQFTQYDHVAKNSWAIAKGSTGFTDHERQLRMEQVVVNLGDLSALAWVERGDQNRARYGFTDKSLRISLELKGEPLQPRTIEFGGPGPSSHKTHYAAVKMEDSLTWIFEYPDVDFERLVAWLNLDLR